MAGCTGDTGVEKTAIPASPAASSPTPTATTGPGSANEAPAAVLKVRVGTQEKAAEGGRVEVEPGEVTFDGSASTDPEGQALSYAWTLDGAPRTETANTLSVTLSAGNHTVTLQVSDGEKDAAASLTIEAKAGAAAPPPAGAVKLHTFVGYFNGTVTAQGDNAAVHKLHPVDVPAGAKQITAWLTWSEAGADGLAILGDVDMRLKDPSGATQATSASFEYEHIRFNDPAKLVPGKWTVDLRPYITNEVQYTLKVIVWGVKPTEKSFTGTLTGGALADGTEGFTSHKVAVPAGASIVAARLAWHDTGDVSDCQNSFADVTDVDLYVYRGSTQVFRSANAFSCEFGFVAAEPGKTLGAAAEYDFRVAPFLVASASYTLLVEYA